jgi:hypothetical protein
MTSRERLEQAKYETLEAMIAAYAAEAVRVARADFRETLDYQPASLDRLEAILNRLCPAPDPLPPADADWLTLLWGSYFGELLRTLHGGVWSMSVYPGGDFSVPTLEIPVPFAALGNLPGAGSRVFPTLKVHRRLSLGSGESLPAFYTMIAARLSAPPMMPLVP